MFILECVIYLIFLSFGGWILIKATLAFVDEKLEKRSKQRLKR
jgi:hypothetical protein